MKSATVDTEDEAFDLRGDDEEDDSSKKLAIPVPMFFIGSAKQRDLLALVWRCVSSKWAAHSVDYKPSARAGLKKFKLDSSPHVKLSIIYPKTRSDDNILRVFKKFTGILKPLDWFQECPDEVVDWNGGCCRVDHVTLERFLKLVLRSKQVTVLNVIEIALVSILASSVCFILDLF